MIFSVADLIYYNPPPGIKVISFDVFDTLLIRKVDPPEATKALVAKCAVNRLSLQISPEDFHSRRVNAEIALCRKAKEAGLDEEYSVTAVNELICSSVPELNGASQMLASLELDVEMALSGAMPGIAEFLAKLSGNYRLVAISDTYLPGSMIEALLEKAKLAQFFGSVYASCDHACNKGSGNLFRRVMEIEGNPPSEWMHIGDNFLSDYFMPRSIGINSILLQDDANQKRKIRQSVLNGMSKGSPIWKGFEVIGALTSTSFLNDTDHAKAKLREWGDKTVGPPVVLFIHELCLRLMREPRKGVYFLAREGYLLKRLYEIFNRELFSGELPQGHYLCISRSTAFLAALSDIGEREIDFVLQDYSVELKDVLRRFGIDDDVDIDRICRAYGVPPSLADKDRIRIILVNLRSNERFRSIVDSRSGEMKQKLGAYLKAEGFFSWDEVALVDVGWHGTIQDYLERYLSLSESGPKVHGYYLGVDYNSSCDYSNKSGLVHDFRKPTVDGVCLTFFKLAFEFSLRAGHGTTIGYESEAGSCKPVFRTNRKEADSFRHIRLIQQGIVSFANSYIDVARVEQFSPENLKPSFLHYHNMRISFPDSDTILAFSPVIHTEDYATEKIRHITGSIKPSELVAPKKAFSRFIEIPWREAALKELHIPLLLFFYYLLKRFLASRRIKSILMIVASNNKGLARKICEFNLSCWTEYQLKMMVMRVKLLATGILVRLLDLLPPRAALFSVQRLIVIKATATKGGLEIWARRSRCS